MKVTAVLESLNEVALCFVNKWWRPVGYATVIGAMAANTILIPILNKTGVSLRELSVLILAFAPLAALRTYEKMQDPRDPLGQQPKDPAQPESDINTN
jgi:hypothetical protein